MRVVKDTSRKVTDAKIIVILLLAALVAGQVRLFKPEVMAITWHLTHRNPSIFADWQVLVPPQWIALRRDNTLVLLRFRRFNDERDDAQISVGRLEIPAGTDFESDDWQAKFLAEMAEQGFRYVTQHTTEVDGVRAYCFDFTIPKQPGIAQWYCDLPTERLSVVYHGGQTHSPGGNFVLRNMRRLPPK
jgi:hypothetical protein